MKKAQIHMMETAMAILVFFLILVIGIVFYINHQKSVLKDKQKEFESLEILKKSQALNFLPELQCSFDGIVDSMCYDIIKVSGFNDIISENSFYYYMLLGNVKITVTEFDPSPESNKFARRWLLFDNPKKEYRGQRYVSMPISLYNATRKYYAFGILNITVYR